MLIAALTGNYGMGKSYVLSLFREMGAVTLESDRIVGILLKDRGVIEKVAGILGKDVITADGALNKKAVAEKIFHDRKMKDKLEALLHPLVFEKVKDFTDKIKKKDSLVIVEVPVLFEGGYQARFEKIITVFTSEETALKRLAMTGVSESDAQARLRNQLPISEKKAGADYVIDNSGSKDQTKSQVEDVYRSLLLDMAKEKADRTK